MIFFMFASLFPRERREKACVCVCVQERKRQMNYANNGLNSVCLSKYPLGDVAVTMTSNTHTHTQKEREACVMCFDLHEQHIIQEYSKGKAVTQTG